MEVNPPIGPIGCIQNMGSEIIKVIYLKSVKITREIPPSFKSDRIDPRSIHSQKPDF